MWKGTFFSNDLYHRILFIFFILEGVHGLEFTEGLDGGYVFLLGASSHTRLAFLWFLPFDQRLLLRSLHAPGNHWWVNRGCAVNLLVFGGGYIGCLYSQHHSIHEVLGCLDQRGGAIQLQEGEWRNMSKSQCVKWGRRATSPSFLTFLASVSTLGCRSYVKYLLGTLMHLAIKMDKNMVLATWLLILVFLNEQTKGQVYLCLLLFCLPDI